MRYSLRMFLSALFFALASYPIPSFAMLCGKPDTLVVGQCSKAQCSEVFKVEYKHLGHECSTRLVISSLEPKEVNGFLTTSPMLSDTERLVIFAQGRGCRIAQERTPHPEPLYYFSESHCYFLLPIPAIDTSEYEKTYLGRHVPIQELSDKSYEELLKWFQKKEQTEYWLSILELYVIPLIIAPLLIYGSMLWVHKTRYSSLHWVFKLILVIPPLLFQLFIFAFTGISTEYSFVTYKFPFLFIIGMYAYPLFHGFFGRFRRSPVDEDVDPVDRGNF